MTFWMTLDDGLDDVFDDGFWMGFGRILDDVGGPKFLESTLRVVHKRPSEIYIGFKASIL